MLLLAPPEPLTQYFLTRKWGENPISFLFSEPQTIVKTLRFEVLGGYKNPINSRSGYCSNVLGVDVDIDNRKVVDEWITTCKYTKTLTLNGAGTYAIVFTIPYASNLRVWIDEVLTVNTGPKPTYLGIRPQVRYTPKDGESCGPTFIERTQTTTEYRTAVDVRVTTRGGQPVGGGVRYGQWMSERPELPATGTTTTADGNRETRSNPRIVTRTNTVRFCEPKSSAGRSRTPLYDRTGYTEGSINPFAMTVHVPRSEAEEEERETEREQEREEREERENEVINSIVERITPSPFTYRVHELPENPEDSKYEIISPQTYTMLAGKKIPDIRYVSVRFLSPEAASSYTLRGYTLRVVPSDIPVSASKPYGPSILERAKARSQDAGKPRLRSPVQGRRLRWSDITPKTPKSHAVGGVQKRLNTRKTVR